MELPLGRSWLLTGMFALTAAAGIVDAVSYLRLGHVFVANMTGNILFIGVTLDPRSGLSPAAQVVALGGFVLGAAVAARLGRAFGDRARAWLAVACGWQAGVLALVAVLVGVGVLRMTGTASLVATTCWARVSGRRHRPRAGWARTT